MDATTIPQFSNVSLSAEKVYKSAKRKEVFSFCGIWTEQEGKDFEKRIADFECIDTQNCKE
ncbi:hypothetical protein AGMMS50212_04880 [Spirochaetia bacterium]|nr:hypothetical protein AGMMS50212_04880 [Spirochaetia bacterium]